MGILKPLVITGSVLALLAAGAVVGDGIARSAAQDQVARQLQTGLGLAEPPVVELGGVPFTAVLVTRRVPSATLEGRDVPLEVSGHQVSFDRIDVDATDLRLGNGQVVVTSARARAVLGYPAVGTLAGVPVGHGGQGRLQVSYTAELFGRELVVVVSAVPMLAESRTRLELGEPEISIAGFDLGQDVAQHIMEQLVRPIDLELPYGLMPDAVSAGDEGITLDLSADDLVVPLG